MFNDPIRSPFHPELQAQEFLRNLGDLSELKEFQLLQSAIVLDVDRVGAKFRILRGGSGGNNKIYSPPATLRVRLLTNSYNQGDAIDPTLLSPDEYYLLYIGSPNIIDYPQAGEVVTCIFDK